MAKTQTPPDEGEAGADVRNTPAQQPPEEGLCTPEEWAEKLGQTKPPTGLTFNGKKPSPRFSWQHAAAAQLHGWAEHSQHTASPLKITKSAYEAALKAAGAPVEVVEEVTVVVTTGGKRIEKKIPQKRQRYAPHEGALSPHAKHGKKRGN